MEKLDLARFAADPDALSPLQVQQAHDKAFDVEAVTSAFFAEYSRVFAQVEKAVAGVTGKDARRLFTQRLFNRLMFIAFVQKKGWLKYPGTGDGGYLNALWAAHERTGRDDANFYDDRLKYLFFHGLNNAAHRDVAGINAGRSTGRETLAQRLIGDVPYLNGGLFERSDDNTDDDPAVVVPDAAVRPILTDLFDRFNFTVTESTPLDVEVAVDPEMLGKVFEELVTGRHESGSYYTPKPIVSFMCHEALKGYLSGRLPGERAGAVAAFVDEPDHPADGLHDPEAVLDALRRVRVCDPACGSGAYLLGMLHELLDLRAALFKSDMKLDAVKTYDRKLEIIQGNVYGVDRDRFAVNIARLRLWLSLAVEFDWDNGKHKVPALPNLDFKIEQGDSLGAPDPSGGFDPGLHREVVAKFITKKREHSTAPAEEKSSLLAEAKALRDDLRLWYRGTGNVKGFDWPVEFPEVFQDGGGFDAVLANPPYGVDVSTAYVKTVRNADSYAAFIGLGSALCSRAGVAVFIVPTSWETGERFSGFRRWLFASTKVSSVVNLPYDVFDIPFVDTCVVSFSPWKTTWDSTGINVLTLPKRAEANLDTISSQLQLLPVVRVRGDANHRLILRADADSILSKLDGCQPTSSYADLKRGIEAYQYLIRESRNGNVSEAAYFTGQVHRYVVKAGDKNRYVDLKDRDLDWHCGLRLWIRRIVSRENRLMAGRAVADAAVKKDLYVLRLKRGQPGQRLSLLLGLLNSSLFSYAYLVRSAAATKDDFRQISLDGLRNLPLPPVSSEAEIIRLTVGREAASGSAVTAADEALDRAVFDAYGLTSADRQTVLQFLNQKG